MERSPAINNKNDTLIAIKCQNIDRQKNRQQYQYEDIWEILFNVSFANMYSNHFIEHIHFSK